MVRFILINRVQYSKSWVVPDGANVVLNDERTSDQYEIIAIPKYADRVVELLSVNFPPRKKWAKHILTAVLAIIMDHEMDLKIDGVEDFEKHVLLNVVGRLLCKAIRAEKMPLDTGHVNAISDSVYEKAEEMFYPSARFVYKFVAVKRELKNLSIITDSLWREIREDCIVLPIRREYHAVVQMKMSKTRLHLRTSASISLEPPKTNSFPSSSSLVINSN